MWNKFKGFIFESKEPKRKKTISYSPSSPNTNPNAIPDNFKLFRNALDHYCELCDRGFKTRGATKIHKTRKHTANE